MHFKSKAEFDEYLRGLKKLYEGGEGIPYVTKDQSLVIKSLHCPKNISYVDYFLKFKDCDFPGYTFIQDVVIIDDEIKAVITPYVSGNDIYRNPLYNEPIDKVIASTMDVPKDVKKVSESSIMTIDVTRSNLIYDGSKITSIDTTRFHKVPTNHDLLYKRNMIYMSEIYRSLIDSNIIRFLMQNHSIYQDYLTDIDLLSNPREVLLGIKRELESYLGEEVTTMHDAVRKLSMK